jgi:hypothetical protein
MLPLQIEGLICLWFGMLKSLSCGKISGISGLLPNAEWLCTSKKSIPHNSEGKGNDDNKIT